MNKFIQIATGGGDESTELYALDTNGDVWRYSYERQKDVSSRYMMTIPVGWKRLVMQRINTEEDGK